MIKELIKWIGNGFETIGLGILLICLTPFMVLLIVMGFDDMDSYDQYIGG